MKFKKKINFHSTCADCVKGRDEGDGRKQREVEECLFP